ncbi:hypothetical protein WJX79_005640 [Trebouxia sp. C0005]
MHCIKLDRGTAAAHTQRWTAGSEGLRLETGMHVIESIVTMHKALELGMTFLDTSDVYGPFNNKELVGKAIKGNRESM